MLTVQEIAEGILAREGGYVDDPDDPGGATNHGITIGTMQRLRADIDGDGDVDKDDVRRLSKAQAREILIEHYFVRPGISRLPPVLHATVFDMQVNAGARAVRILQQLLCDMDEPVSVDGAIGLQTVAAAERAAEAAPEYIADAYGIARRNFYYALAGRRPSARKYVMRRDGGKGGWIRRVEEFISPRYHLTAEEHLTRTRAWG